MIYLEFWELARHDGEIRIKRIKGVDGTVVSYPGAYGGEVASKAGLRPWGKILCAGYRPFWKAQRDFSSLHGELVLEITERENLNQCCLDRESCLCIIREHERE